MKSDAMARSRPVMRTVDPRSMGAESSPAIAFHVSPGGPDHPGHLGGDLEPRVQPISTPSSARCRANACARAALGLEPRASRL